MPPSTKQQTRPARSRLDNRQSMSTANGNIILPEWLDRLIFDNLGGKYCRANKDMTVIDWNKAEIQNYLGTYFPRSYAESLCIFTDYFQSHPQAWANRKQISIFDFGSGTGGEIIGLLTALQPFNNLQQIRIVAFDGNLHALRFFEQILKEYRTHVSTEITHAVIPFVIDDFYDMSILLQELRESFDIIITFKAICEFVTKQQFDTTNPYEHFVKTFLPKLNSGGIMALVDISSHNCVSQEWLPIMLEKGLQTLPCRIVDENQGFNEPFRISHSRCANDISKIVWKIIEKEHHKTIVP